MPPLILPEICDRAAAKALYPDMCDGLGSTALVIDASNVSRIGQAMLQLLVSAQRSEAGITICDASDAFKSATNLSGLSNVLAEESSQ